MTEDGVHLRLYPLWNVYFALVAVAVGAAVVFVGDVSPVRRGVAVLAIAAMALVHAGRGRRLGFGDDAGRPAVVVLTAQVVLFTVAVGASTFSTYLLFALLPMIFQVASLRMAVWFVVAVNLVPVAVGLVMRGPTVDVLGYQGAIAVVSTAFALWFGFWISRVVDQSVERAALIAELERSRAEVARLSHEAGAAAERARLAGEIHDTLAQGFTSIIALLQTADPGLADERLALAVRTARENLAEARALVAALSPSALTSGSLPDAVRRQASRFTEESGIPVTLRLSGAVRELPTATEVVLLRATQEALANIRRHAGAAEAAVLLAYGETSVRLVIRDDGTGLAAAPEGFGLRGMRARADQVAGVLRVSGDSEAGTTIELEVPA